MLIHEGLAVVSVKVLRSPSKARQPFASLVPPFPQTTVEAAAMEGTTAIFSIGKVLVDISSLSASKNC
ncbi:hypothetical protein D3C75_1259800 [compost metagenome]